MRANSFVIVFVLMCFGMCAQSKWDKSLVVDYKMTDKDDKLVNHFELKKDTLFYEWIEKTRHQTKKMVMDSDLENKILAAIDNNNALKFKSARRSKGTQNIVFTYKKGRKTKVFIFPQPIKQDSKEEKFIQEFMEPILTKVFEQELKSSPR